MKPLLALLAASALALPASSQDSDLNQPLKIKFQTAVKDASLVAVKGPEPWKEPATDTAEAPRSLQWLLTMSGRAGPAQDYEHVILFDADVRDDDGQPDLGMRRRWRAQIESLKKQLLAAGVRAERVRVASLYSADDLRIPFEASTNPKIVYVFSHSGPYLLQFNIGDLDFRREAVVQFFLKHNVQAIVAYGCSFLAPDPAAQKLLIAALGDRKLVVVGHEKPSTGRDDSEFHPENPLYVEDMSRECPIQRAPRCERKDAAAAPAFPFSSKCAPH